MTHGERAEQLFLQGYNCAQAVTCAFAPELGLPIETVARMVSPFGGGMGRLREVCGAFSGALAVLGMLYGYSEPGAAEAKHALYVDVQALAAAFRERNGSLHCHALLGLPQGASDPKPEPRTPDFYRRRRCASFVHTAADILEEYCAAHPRG